ncbi:GNAT family N-acetyltransferase [Microtetraspora sp. NBRC 16547]|uniref:GNAT family N-acetyltransferase n=1 Tax=Microtetraspora sp. NBRC 16547 TaxID=3030993 RepID=UPI0024A478C4|nr:GNAT family N-acetyltransferase [Microtetraspora sp. NBRC 16547]GLW98035.1 putative N-acetyltransferase YesJ [Microtetraspora sp. NBRC 16547]
MPSRILLPGTFTLRRAAHGDLPAVLALLAEAAKWLDSHGVRQWPAGGFPASRIEPLIDAGAMYVLDDGTGAAATVALDGHADPEFWGRADRPDTARYVHKLAVSRAYAGEGLGEALLDWAGLRAAAEGRRWLRLDCSKDNLRLQRYYAELGFRHVRTVDLAHRASGALFERQAGATVTSARTRY